MVSEVKGKNKQADERKKYDRPRGNKAGNLENSNIRIMPQ